MCKVYTVMWELQAVALMLCTMALWLSSKVVALHFNNSTAKAYLIKQGDKSLLFFQDYPAIF